MKKKLAFIFFIALLLFVYYYKTRRTLIDISAFKMYAINFTPCIDSLNSIDNRNLKKCASFSLPPEEVVKILKNSEITLEFRKYVLLTTLKLYSFQIQEYHQSFEIREFPYIFYRYSDSNALTNALCEVVGKNFLERKLGPEFLSAEISYEYVIKDPFYYNDPYIKKYIHIVDSISANLN